jgi:phosphatidylserine/phosphatidylglycerophosphate/cardiolipin synthase-like enzyme
VRIHLLWGIDRSASFEDEFGADACALLDLLAPAELKTGGLYVARRPAAVHAKLLVVDLAWALVSTCNFLNAPPDRTEHELGVKVDGPFETATVAATTTRVLRDERPYAARAVCSALAWARSLVPDYRLQPLVLDEPSLDGRRVFVPSIDVGFSLHAPEDNLLSWNIWKSDWQRRASTLQQELDLTGTLVSPVTDGQHRRLLLESVRRAERRIVVASPKVGLAALGDLALLAFRAAAKRGVEVTVIHREPIDFGSELASRARALEEAGVRFERRRSHAKALVCDDWATISSFNFLSLEGYYDTHQRSRHELGLRVFANQFADHVVASLRAAALCAS